MRTTIDALRARADASVVVAGVCLLLVLAHGSATLLTAFTARAGLSVVPSALGVPFALPGLRATPLGATDRAWQLCENFAALLLVATATARMRRHLRVRPDAGRGRRLLAGWTALIAGTAVAGTWRGMVAARMVEASLWGWLLLPLVGALFGALWGLLLGWLPGVAALTRTGPLRAAA
ncbi:hypothetical protein [Streptomyces sp. Je 1-369]|uniref:hypothetical protein n=1 Tax=Streptomyces sp. Je 1-369 TaxID=2966192 RepID=UPI00228645D0|nr:hypothetical protein [Streptomyces sp. Je 1-369]WAL97576.1 hypothetical protein NOO62_25620 [Streptomyces sp. Je 1-369]